MSTATEEVRQEIAATRAQLAATADELKTALGERVATAKETVDPRHYAREYPWAALGIALGVGFALAMTGADAKAAAGVAEGASMAKDAITDGAERAKDLVMERIHGDPAADDAAPAPMGGLRAKVATAVDDMLHYGLTEILTGIGARVV